MGLGKFGGFVAAGFVLLCAAPTARADQFVLLDVVDTHAGNGSHQRYVPSAGIPSNWASPVDYRAGIVHIHVELTKMASDHGIHWQVCFEQPDTVPDGSYFCNSVVMPMPTTGTYDLDIHLGGPEVCCLDGQYDFAAPPKKLALIVKDANKKKIDTGQGYIGEPDYSLYFPLEAHVVVTMVSNGATYMPPAEEPDAGMDAATDPDGGTPQNDAATPEDAAVNPGSDSGTRPPQDSGIPPQPNDAIQGGCSLGPGPSQTGPWWLVPIVLVLRRRKPRSRKSSFPV